MPKIDWGRPEYGAFVREGLARGDSHRQIAEGLNSIYGLALNKDDVRGYLRYRGKAPIADEPEETPQERFDAAVRKERQKTEDRLMAKEMAAAVRAEARWQEFLDIFSHETRMTPRGEVRPVVIPTGSGTPETFTQLVSDIHIGKLVDPAVVGSSFGYSIPIFEQRMARLKNRILRLYGLHSKTAPFERFRLYFMGDGVDGVDMRRGHAHRVDVQTATQQTLILVYAFEAMLRELTTALGIPFEVVWDYGNHGRVGDFGVNLPADNWDFIAGQMLQIACRDLIADGKVVFHADTLKYSITDLGPLRVYSSHGDGIKGGDGFSGLPINGMARAAAKDTGLHVQLFDLYLMAHFHTPQDITTQTSRIIMNGAWDGGDDYSVNGIKAASDPVQWAFGIHPENGITWQSRIILTPNAERRSASPVATF